MSVVFGSESVNVGCFSLSVARSGTCVHLCVSSVHQCDWLKLTKCPGLTFTFARVLVLARIDGPRSQPIDAKNHTLCVVRALMSTLACVCHRQRDWATSAGSHAARHGHSRRTVAFFVTVDVSHLIRTLSDNLP